MVKSRVEAWCWAAQGCSWRTGSCPRGSPAEWQRCGICGMAVPVQKAGFGDKQCWFNPRNVGEGRGAADKPWACAGKIFLWPSGGDLCRGWCFAELNGTGFSRLPPAGLIFWHTRLGWILDLFWICPPALPDGHEGLANSTGAAGMTQWASIRDRSGGSLELLEISPFFK